MSQTEVYQLLKNNKGKWYTAKDITNALKLNHTTTNENVARLIKHDKEIEVKYVENPRHGPKKRYLRIR